MRFTLELVAWLLAAIWVFKQFNGWTSYLAAIACSLILMGLWVSFTVPADPSRSGKAPVPIDGRLRLALEIIEFGLGYWAGYLLYGSIAGATILALIIIHHLLYFSRMQWIWKQRKSMYQR